MEKDKFFSKELIKISLDAKTDHEAIRQLSLMLFERGYVKKSFLNAVIERERTFATGLPCEICGIAIPHADPIHVNEMAIAIGVLKEPIKFGMMGGTKKIDVDLIFLMALKDCDSQIVMLKRFADFFQKDEYIGKIRSASSPDQILQVMEHYFYTNEKEGIIDD